MRSLFLKKTGKSLRTNKQHIEIVISQFSLILVFLSYYSVFYINHKSDFEILFSNQSFSLIIGVIVAQIVLSYCLEFIESGFLKSVYLFIVLSAFALLNLVGFFVYTTEFLNKYLTFYLRIRDFLLIMLVGLAFGSYFLRNKFAFTIKALNLFLIIFIIINLVNGWFFNTSVEENAISSKEQLSESALKISQDINRNRADSANILFILLDEYSSPDELIKFVDNDTDLHLLNSYLDSTGFMVKNNLTLKNSTINSLNMLFNRNSDLTFRDESHRNATKELRESSVIRIIENKGYSFKNFSFFNIGNHDSFYHWQGPYSYDNFELLLSLSVYPLILSNLKEDSTSNAGYNKEVEKLSLKYLNSLHPNQGSFVYVHFLFPHGPFYLEDEFPYLKRNLDNYIKFWRFSNRKLIRYLESIHDLNSYKIIITGDHGFRSDRNINPSKTLTAFYNFSNRELDSIKYVQDIGTLLSSQ